MEDEGPSPPFSVKKVRLVQSEDEEEEEEEVGFVCAKLFLDKDKRVHFGAFLEHQLNERRCSFEMLLFA